MDEDPGFGVGELAGDFRPGEARVERDEDGPEDQQTTVRVTDTLLHPLTASERTMLHLPLRKVAAAGMK
ncbi:hypothetical protein [Streptomyces sp. NPDC014006]|uniref:hypothetical protein n=1 Tax=Streptomyces sp. NPDC014006 TaxID=3364870 RepID=UPI0036FBEF13